MTDTPDAGIAHDRLLAQTVARHFDTATIDGAGTRVDLGVEGLAIDCRIGSAQEFGGMHSAQLLMTLSGGPWREPVELAVNGYAETLADAITSGGCMWSCTFVSILDAALTREPAAEVQTVEVSLAGTPMTAFLGTFDTVLHFEPGGEQTHDARKRLGASPCIAPALLGALDATVAGDEARTLSIASVYFGEIGDQRIIELRLDGKPFHFDEQGFSDVEPAPAQQMVSLRELAMLIPAS